MTAISVKNKLDKHLAYLDQDSNNINLLLEISALYMGLEDWNNAQHYLNKASTIDREFCLANQGLLALNQGNLSEAQQHFQEALTVEDTPVIRYNLALTHYINEEYQLARDLIEPIIEEATHPFMQLLFARILFQEQALTEAIAVLEALIQQTPDDSDVLGFLSLLYFDNNQEELANSLSQQTLALDPQNYEAKIVNIMLRLLTQETNVDEIKQLLDINPQDSRLWFALGSTYMTQADTGNAINSLQQAVALSPQFYDCYIALAWCQLLQDDIEDAEANYQHALTLAPHYADAVGGIALISTLNKEHDKAQQWIEKAYALNTECFLAQIAETLMLSHTSPQQAQLLNKLAQKETSISEQLGNIIEQLQHH